MPTEKRLCIIHGGQTGVDRGAHFGALDAGHAIRGYMPKNRDDEAGLIPPDVAKYLKPVLYGSYAARTEVNVELCHVLLVIVADPQKPYATPGTCATLQHARKMSKSSLVVGPGDVARAATWLLKRFADLPAGQCRLMIAGPRASRWADGENAAFEIVSSLPSGETP